MDGHDLPSDSDASDDDYIPPGGESDGPSEEESGPDDNELQDDADSGNESPKSKGKKRKSKQKQPRSKKTLKKELESGGSQENTDSSDKTGAQKELTEEDEKKKADSLWADFMKDVGVPPKKKIESPAAKTESPSSKIETSQAAPPVREKENTVTVTQIFEFAGEEVKVTKEVSADSAEARLKASAPPSAAKKPGPVSGPPPARRGGLGGISSVLSQIGKKAKISTLEKSKLDWEGFKKDQGIEDELQTFNRGKDGYLEKQDFLQRADLRQFEIEKELRTTRRSTR